MSNNNYNDNLVLTEHPPWAQQFWDDLVPDKDAVANHPLFQAMAAGTLPVERFRFALLNFYPLVANFPHYMALNLARATDNGDGAITAARNWLIGNINIEQRHLFWYRDWAKGFGVTDEELNQVEPPAAMDAVNHYMWFINQRGSLGEALAATNLAIEWATGEWSQHVVKGMKRYAEEGKATIDKRSMAWLRAHAHYDDEHPHEAMELVKLTCRDDDSRHRAFRAARKGMAYYLLALDHCMSAELE